MAEDVLTFEEMMRRKGAKPEEQRGELLPNLGGNSAAEDDTGELEVDASKSADETKRSKKGAK